MINARNICFCIIISFLFLTASNAHADTATYTLDNVILVDGQQITGTFIWTFSADDFTGGSGEFTSLNIPYTGYSLTNGNLNIDIQTNSIEISGNGDYHDQGLDISMFLSPPLSPTQSASLDLGLSFFECCGNGFRSQPFNNGNIAPSTSPGLELTGLDTKSAVCTNKTSGEKQRIRIFGSTSWSCADAGIASQESDIIRLVTIGHADGLSPVGATLTDITPLKARCKNLTTGIVVFIKPLHSSTVNCEAEGLAVTAGDKVSVMGMGKGLADNF